MMKWKVERWYEKTTLDFILSRWVGREIVSKLPKDYIGYYGYEYLTMTFGSAVVKYDGDYCKKMSRENTKIEQLKFNFGRGSSPAKKIIFTFTINRYKFTRAVNLISKKGKKK